LRKRVLEDKLRAERASHWAALSGEMVLGEYAWQQGRARAAAEVAG
jgi:hypothetical protein